MCFFISHFWVVYKKKPVDYHLKISLLQTVKLSFFLGIGYCWLLPTTQ